MLTADRVAITGLGLIGSWGTTLDDLWGAQQLGNADFAPCSRYDNGLPAAEIVGFNANAMLRSSQLSRYMLVAQYAMVATHMAIEQAGIIPKRGSRDDSIGIAFGTSNGPGVATQQIYDDLINKGAIAVKPRAFQESVFNAPASLASIHFGFSGPIQVLPMSGCGGVAVLFQAAMMLADPNISTVIALCSDEMCDAIQSGYNDVKWHATYDAEGGLTEGAVMGEGAVALVLERMEDAQKRKVPIIAELAGVGLANDAAALAFPAADGRGLSTAIRACLEDAQMDADMVDMILTGASGSKIDDCLEKAALDAVFGADHPISGNAKRSTGFCMGVAALVEVALAIAAITKGKPPNSVPSRNPATPIKNVLCNAIGLNGQFGAILVKSIST